jgi:hypothetical protein
MHSLTMTHFTWPKSRLSRKVISGLGALSEFAS